MPKTFRVRVTGLKEAVAALHELPDAIQPAAVQGALSDAAQPMLQAAIDAAPERTGKLKSKIVVSDELAKTQSDGRDKPGRIRLFLGALGGRGGAPQAHLVEFGTGPRYHESGKYVGEMPAQPFMRPAYDAHKRELIADFSKRLLAIVEHAKNLVRRHNVG